MYKKVTPSKTGLKVNTSYQGETIEAKVRRIVNNKEPITDGAPLVYTDRKDGVQPEYDIRTDRWEVAVEAMDAVNKSHKAKREERHKTEEQKLQEKNEKALQEAKQKLKQQQDNDLLQQFGGAEPIQPTGK